MHRLEKGLLILGLAGWITLGLAHIVIVMTGPKGWRPDRSAPGADAVVGHPHDTDPLAVAGPRDLARESEASTDVPLMLALPASTDSADLVYTRYQLAHVLYPRRVQVFRATDAAAVPPLAFDSGLLVVAPGVSPTPACRPVARTAGHRLLECREP